MAASTQSNRQFPPHRGVVSDGAEKVVATNVDAFDLALTNSGNIYYTDPVHKTLVLIDSKGQRRTVYAGGGIKRQSALAF